MKKFSSSRRKLSLSKTTIRQLSYRRLAAVNGGTLVPLPETTGMNQVQGNGGDSESAIGCLVTLQC